MELVNVAAQTTIFFRKLLSTPTGTAQGSPQYCRESIGGSPIGCLYAIDCSLMGCLYCINRLHHSNQQALWTNVPTLQMFLISCSVHWSRALPSHLSYKTSQQSKIFQRDSAHEVTKTITAQAWQLHPSLSTIKYRTRAHSLLMVHSKHTNTAYHPRNLTQRPGSDHSRGGGRCSSD